MLALRRLREKRGLTLCELAQMVGVTPGAVSHWETGRRKIGLDDAAKIARALGCTVDDLLVEE
jgi:transcriptional regulator with XRE-family HTH domain